jgi:hypothetical protein
MTQRCMENGSHAHAVAFQMSRCGTFGSFHEEPGKGNSDRIDAVVRGAGKRLTVDGRQLTVKS